MKKRRAQIREVSPSPSPSTATLLKLKLIANAITYDLLVGCVHVFQTSKFIIIIIATRTFKMKNKILKRENIGKGAIHKVGPGRGGGCGWVGGGGGRGG